MKEPTLFAFSERDSAAQFMFFVIASGAGGLFIPLYVWELCGAPAGVAYIVFALAVLLGLRDSIEVTPSKTVFTRKWLFIPYRRYSAPFINDLWYDSDCGDAEGASGVVVKLGSREIYIGSAKTMRHLFRSLTPLKAHSS